MNVELREITADDCARLAQLEEVLFPGDSPWTLSDFVHEIAQSHTFYIGAVITTAEGEQLLVGYAGLAMLGVATEPEFEVHTIGVDPRFQRRGIARLLMDNLTHIADSYGGAMFLEVRTDNEPAVSLYRAYGFEQIGVRKRYYQPSGADAFTMRRSPQLLKK
ncbi:ribosomal-protein-alanine N-acetyltransferase [Corynebacterium sp. sy017]|uniref:ribosomal protein S18-alanine N-acetyltransferase n=1 Tax=unclassified Corynebacterium TaxID=2624378 RepID=UPI00118666B6|nr:MULTISPECIES: ribosomal protein S18-alanine N-acetyltransferase [unclassified Corynebacterium]MBP3088665.1 ribosomal-protein-alanine N-acetyltransferase [Corynebacterium sp. sy017]TSD91956.1 ribosomal-protein-alanine N-acetyltransferase [Corynebacterium sp. SY003]